MGSRILVIEDNPANLELMLYLLRAYKHEALGAEAGEKGLALARSERPDLVVCDIQLPGIDGYEVVRRLKSDPATTSLPVIAVTAFAMVGDRDRVLSAGFDGYIGKPIAPESFVGEVEQFLGPKANGMPPRHGGATAATPPERAAHAGARILVVDNSAANRELLASTLAPFGYDVTVAANVPAALASAAVRRPDLIISDMHMPGMNGLELLARIQADVELREVPFAFASATTWNEREQRRATELGADMFILMPCEPRALLRHVEELLSREAVSHGDHTRR